MFQRSKHDTPAAGEEFPGREQFREVQGEPAAQPARAAAPGRREAAVIGPSIRIDGDLQGEEDLVIEGEVKGTVHFRNNSLTIGSQGKVKADIYAHNIFVDGSMEGDLFGAERVSIRKSAEVRGNITSPRVSLEDGARFKGAIEMDPRAEALQKAFGDRGGAPAGASPAPPKPVPAAGTGAGATAGRAAESPGKKSTGG